MDRLQKLQDTKKAIEEELRKEQAEALRIEKDKRRAEIEIKEAVERKQEDIRLFNQTNRTIEEFMSFLGTDIKLDINSPIFIMIIFKHILRDSSIFVIASKMQSYFREKKARDK